MKAPMTNQTRHELHWSFVHWCLMFMDLVIGH